jgi:hypothetical protein
MAKKYLKFPQAANGSLIKEAADEILKLQPYEDYRQTLMEINKYESPYYNDSRSI